MPDDRETQATDAGIASDDTVQQDSTTGPPVTGSGRVIRVNRSSAVKIGRYEVVRRVGRGGMGAVYEANDPELGRHVAIKVLRDDRDDSRLTEALRREAQALAKLVHPNVLSVYDVGVDSGQVFIVMQLVDGDTIDHWLKARSARPAEIVAAFRQAGRGLAAAHAAGLVHCDFKPSNVLVDRDGVVRVGDFGLARLSVALDTPSPEGAPQTGESKMTNVAGTPAYMAPEQFEGMPNAASDQYSFCVALYEVLSGGRPFAESTIDDVSSARARVPRPLPRSAGVPAYVSRALQRGLLPDPVARFPSMDALLDALAPRTWQRGALIAGAIAALGGAGLAAALALRHAPPPGLTQPDFAAARALTHFGMSGCAYAPYVDGDRVIFDLTKGDAVDLYELPLVGGVPRQLTSAPTWEWRANQGRHSGEVIHMVTDATGEEAPGAMFLDVATGAETVAAAVHAVDAVVTKHGIVYSAVGGQELRRIADGGDTVLVTPKGHFAQLAVSRSGDRVAVSGMGLDEPLCIVDILTAALDCIKPARTVRPVFGFEDRALYYAAPDGLHRRELATGKDVPLSSSVDAQGGLAMAADGTALVYSDCGTRSQIVDASTAPPTVVVDDPSAELPDATSTSHLVWVRYVRRTPVIMARREDGRELQLTDPSFGAASGPAISPDGTRVVFQAGPARGGIYTIDLEPGAAPQQITANPHDVRPIWIDDNLLAFTRGDDASVPQVYVVSASGGPPRKVGAGSRRAVGSSGGRLLVQGHHVLRWLDVAAGAESDGPSGEQVEDAYLATSPNGKWLVAQYGEGQALWRMSLDPPGKMEHVRQLLTGQTASGAAITNDGRVIVAPSTWAGDLYLIPARPDGRL